MSTVQPGVLADVPQGCRYLNWSLVPGADPLPSLKALGEVETGDELVVGVGQSVISLLGKEIPGLRPFPTLVGPGVDIPATPAALWIWIRGTDRGRMVHHTNRLKGILEPAFRLSEVVDGFQHDVTPEGMGRDLSGYEDGTENPEGEEAVEVAVVQGGGPGRDGSTFVATQRWVHELATLDKMSQKERDDMMGRRRSDNEEVEDAPPSAHVKRTAQEDFEPEAFLLRRSMPWADAREEGLVFVAFGRSLDAFEAILNRMSGLEDGTVDALFRFSRPVTGAHFWCPPMKGGKLNLEALGIQP